MKILFWPLHPMEAFGAAGMLVSLLVLLVADAPGIACIIMLVSGPFLLRGQTLRHREIMKRLREME